MEIKYDKKIDSKYIRIKKGKVSFTKRNKDWLLFDHAKNGNILGVEILEASKHPIAISTINGELFNVGKVVSLEKVDNGVELSLLGLNQINNKNNLWLTPAIND